MTTLFHFAAVVTPVSFAAGLIDEAPPAARWGANGPVADRTLTPAERTFVADWSRARETRMIPSAEMCETGAVEDAYEEPAGEPPTAPFEMHPMATMRGVDPLDRAWFSGYSVGRANIAANPPSGLNSEEARTWRAGHAVGYLDAAGAKAKEMALASA